MENYTEFRSYLNSSDEAQVALDNLVRIHTPKFNNLSEFKMLDVGCSDGDLTISLSKHFKDIFDKFNVISIEPEKVSFDRFVERTKNIDNIQPKNTTMQQYLKNNLNKKRIFDFIFFSHCFYYLPKKDWDLIIDGSNRLLKKNGLISIVQDSYNGEIYKLKDLISGGKEVTLKYGYFHYAEDVENYLNSKDINFETDSYLFYLFVEDNEKKVENFAKRLSFLYRTYPNLILPKYEKEIRELLEHNKKEDNGYYIENKAKIITFSKNLK